MATEFEQFQEGQEPPQEDKPKGVQPPVKQGGVPWQDPFASKQPKPNPIIPPVKKPAPKKQKVGELRPVELPDDFVSFAELEQSFQQSKTYDQSIKEYERGFKGESEEYKKEWMGEQTYDAYTKELGQKRMADFTKERVIAKYNTLLPKVEQKILGKDGEYFVNDDGTLWDEFNEKDKAGNEHVRYSKILSEVEKIVRQQGGGGALATDYIATKIYQQAQAIQYQKLAIKKANEQAKQEGIKILPTGQVSVIGEEEIKSEYVNIVSKAKSRQSAFVESSKSAFEAEANPVIQKYNTEIEATVNGAPMSMMEAKTQVSLKYSDQGVDNTFAGNISALSPKEKEAKINAEAVELFNSTNKEYFERYVTPKIQEYGKTITELQKKHNEIRVRKGQEIVSSAKEEYGRFLKKAEVVNSMAFERYKRIITSSFSEVERERGMKQMGQYLSYDRFNPLHIYKALGDELAGSFGGMIKSIGAYMGAAGLPYGISSEFQKWGSDVQQGQEKLRPSFTEGYFDPVYWAQSTGRLLGTALPTTAAIAFTKSPYWAGLAGNAMESAAMGGDRYLNGLANGEDAAVAANQGKSVFNANTSMIVFDALWAKGFADVFTGKSLKQKVGSSMVGNLGNSVQETLQGSFDQGVDELKNPLSKENLEVGAEVFGSSTIMSAVGLGGGYVVGRFKKTDIAPSAAAQLLTEMNKRYGSQRGAAVAEMLRMEGTLSDVEMDKVKGYSDAINGYIEEANTLELGEAEARAYAGIRFEIKQLEEKKAELKDEEAQGLVDKQIKEKQTVLEKIVSGEQKITTITVAGQPISAYEDKVQELAKEPEAQALVNEGVVTGKDLAPQEIAEQTAPPAVDSEVNQEKVLADEVRQAVRDGKFPGLNADVLDQTPDQDVVDFIYDQATQTTNDPITGEPTTARPLLDKTFGKELVDKIIQSKQQPVGDSQIANQEAAKPLAQMTDEELDAKRKEFESSFEVQPEATTPQDETKVAAPKRSVQAVINRLQQAFHSAKVTFNQEEYDAEVAANPQAQQVTDRGGRVYGLVSGNKILINPAYSNFNTPIHEFGHLWLNAIKDSNPALYNKGLELIEGSEYMDAINANPVYASLSEEAKKQEALAAAIGDKGEGFVNEARKNNFKNWLRDLYKTLKQYARIFNMTEDEIQDISLDEFLGAANEQLFSGQPVAETAQAEGAQAEEFEPVDMDATEGLSYLNQNKRQIVEVREGTATASMMFAKDGSVYISTVINEAKGNGAASKLLDKIVAKADELGLTLTLNAMPFSYKKGLNMQELVDWYGRKGFEVVREVKDKETGEIEATYMERTPSNFQAETHPLYQTLKNLAEATAEQERRKGLSKEEVAQNVENQLRAKLKDLSDRGIIKNGYLNLVAAAKGLAQEYAGIAAAANKQDAANQRFASPEVQSLVEGANQVAKDLKEANKGLKTGKLTKKQVQEKVEAHLKGEIDEMFQNGTQPQGLSWIQARAMVPAIAKDAAEAAFPSRTKSPQEEQKMTMSVRDWIANSVSNQIRAIKSTRIRISAIAKVASAVMKQFAEEYGVRINFTAAEVNTVVKEVLNQTFGEDVDIEAVEGSVQVFTNIVEKAVKKTLLKKTKLLLAKLQDGISGAKFGGFDGGVASLVQRLASIDTDFWYKSNVSVEDLYDLNYFLTQMTKPVPNTKNLNKAILIAEGVKELPAAEPTTEANSLINRINTLNNQIKDDKLDGAGYKELAKIKERMEALRQEIGTNPSFTAEEVAKINKAYDELVANMPDDIDSDIEKATEEVKDEALNAADRLTASLEDPAFRYSIPHSALYKLYMQFVGMMSREYVGAQSPEWQAKFTSVVNEIFNGNINKFMFELMGEFAKNKLKAGHKQWAKNTSKQYDPSKKKGIGRFANEVRSKLVDIFATRNPKVIADHMALIAITSLDSEIGGEFDEFELGWLNKNVFLPIQKGLNAAQAGMNDGIEGIQNGMVLLVDKENRRAIDIGIKKMMEQMDTGGFFGVKFAAWRKKAFGSKGTGFYMEVATRMATIIANQIDEVSNIAEGEQVTDIALLRNILGITADKYDGSTMQQRFKGKSIFDKANTEDEIYERIAYAILTDSGTKTLAEMSAQELLDKLPPKIREALDSWRGHINAQQPLVEIAMLMTGRTNTFLQNYFPRNTQSPSTDGTFIDASGNNKNDTISDIIAAVNGASSVIGVDAGQLKSRTGNVDRLDLNGARVLKRNLEALHMVLNMKPVLEEVSGLTAASEELNQENDTEAKVFADAIAIAAEQRLGFGLGSYEKASEARFSFPYKAIAAVTSFARGYLLLGIRRMFNDFLSNIIKITFASSFANKRFDVSGFRATNIRRTLDTWEKYKDVATFFGSHMYAIMGNNTDNLMYEFSRSTNSVKREQMVQGWQDILPKQSAWMSRFDFAFERLTGEKFEPAEWAKERGEYRVKFRDAAERAVETADVFIERQVGSSSIISSPLRYNLVLPGIGRMIRNMRNKSSGPGTLTVSRDSSMPMIFRFMQTFQTTQFGLFQSYMRNALIMRSRSWNQRGLDVTRAFTETIVPTLNYVVTATALGYLHATINAAANTADDDDDRDKLYKELASASFSSRWKRKIELVVNENFDGEKLTSQALNALSSVALNPSITSTMKIPYGWILFKTWKEQAVVDLMKFGGNKAKYNEAKRKIQETESFLFGMGGIRPIELFPSNEDYYESIRRYYKPGTESEFVADIINGIGAFGVFYGEVNRAIDWKQLIAKADKNEALSKEELYIAAGLKLFGYYFSQKMMTGSAVGMMGNMISGDVSKVGNMMITDQKIINTGIEIAASKAKKAAKKKNSKKSAKKKASSYMSRK